MNARNQIMGAERTREVVYAIREIAAIAEKLLAEGRDLVNLNIGDPIKSDFETPPHMIEAIHRGMLEGNTGYGPSYGVPAAVEAIERDAARQGIDNVDQVFVTTGASEGIELALTALVNPGDKVLLPMPGYPLYTAVMSKLGGESVPYFLDEANAWQPDVADIEAKVDERTVAIVVINPNNPTGSIADEDTLRQVVEIAEKRDLLILADEIYNKILFPGEKHVPLGSLAGGHPCMTFNGLSKCYLGPGLRTGWTILSGDLDRMADFKDAFTKMVRARLCPNTPMQWAIPAALEGDQSHVGEVMAKVSGRADLVASRLEQIEEFGFVRPRGAFYVFPSIDCPGSDWDFCVELLKDKGVVTVPGSGFGQRPGTKHMRIVLLQTDAQLGEAMDRIESFVAKKRS